MNLEVNNWYRDITDGEDLSYFKIISFIPNGVLATNVIITHYNELILLQKETFVLGIRNKLKLADSTEVGNIKKVLTKFIFESI